jgi:bifunctional DNA-binding transcriptional regulator/antitoxin component of YhaV-PrlF toxin-antitoxin module
MTERIFYKPAMKSGETQWQIYIPKAIAEGIGLENRDELKITVEKTGRKIPAGFNRFKPKNKERALREQAENESNNV